jgi:hypothetical protein
MVFSCARLLKFALHAATTYPYLVMKHRGYGVMDRYLILGEYVGVYHELFRTPTAKDRRVVTKSTYFLLGELWYLSHDLSYIW